MRKQTKCFSYLRLTKRGAPRVKDTLCEGQIFKFRNQQNAFRINALTEKSVRYDVGYMTKGKFKPFDRHSTTKATIFEALVNREIDIIK